MSIGSYVYSQENELISLSDFSSPDIVFRDSKENVFKALGLPDKEVNSILCSIDTVFCPKLKYVRSDRKIRLYIYEKLGLKYYSLNGDSLQLVSIDLKKNKKSIVYLRSFVLSHKTRMQSMINEFTLIKDQDYCEHTIEYFDPISRKSKDLIYVNIATYKPMFFSVKFLFNRRERLEYILFGYNNGNIDPVLIGDCDEL